ncbi:ATP-binding protein [Pseudokineococcus lusitanus]|uniref:DNA repair exonuclease SbcCD ATPase subunit n=1 Tax=Pseudokineococcus lusitanus TaxID=763993 RepID=A0A3N1HSU5_9ACTN|nr:ATP-binding protein [Pseudokineococcus lusitanus]ROP45593.1 DNA repair exonuclease SbcCD ATPase subunit [Pseudokineococcus lusitanus]
MRVLRLRLQNFRGVADREVTPAPTGVTVLAGDNEVGKTSLVEALDMLLDEYDDARKKAVRRTQPVGQDVPTVVEAEVQAGAHRFTYRKQWHRQPSTRLVVHEPAPEQLAGREAHDWVLAVLGAEVDLPLWRALRLQQGVPLEQADLQARSSLAQALDATVAGTVGGEREETLVARAEEEFLRYWTPTGGRRTEARTLEADVAAASARVTALEAEVAGVERVVERLDRARADAADERAAGAQDAAAVRDAEERVADLHGVVRAVEVARGALAAADAAAATAERERAGRRALLARAEEAREAAAERDVAAATAAADLAAAEDHLRAVARELELARDAAAARREEREDALAAEQRHAEVVEVTRLRAVLADAVAAQRRVAAAEEAVAAAPVDDAALALVEDAARALAVAAARAGAATPVVVLEGAGRTLLTSDGERVLDEGPEEVRLVGGTWFEAGGVRVSARPSADQERAEADARRAEDALAGLCARLGVDDAAAAATAARARREATAELERARDAARRAASGEDLDAARRRVARADDLEGSPDAAAGADDAAADAGAATGEHLRRRREEADGALGAADLAVVRAGVRLEAAREAVDGAAARSADRTAAATAADARERVVLDELAGARAALPDDRAAEDAEDALRRRGEAAASLAVAEAAVAVAGVADAQAELDLRRARLLDGQKRLRAHEDEVGALTAVLEAQGGLGLAEQLGQARAEEERARRALVAWDRRATAARTLHEALQAARASAHAAYVEPLRAQLHRLAVPVFGPDVQVEVGPDLRVVSRTLGGVTVPFEQLSAGAREQLALLGRLACAVLVSGGAGVPVVVDDALGWSDPRRLDGMARALSVAGASCQVLVLTCVPDRYRLVTGARTERLHA